MAPVYAETVVIFNLNKYSCVDGTFIHIYIWYRGPGSSVGIATDYGLDGPGIESQWGERFRTRPDRPWGPPSLLCNGYRVFPGGVKLPGRGADHPPLPSTEVMKE
jgi:hypothetical protein